MYHVAYLTLSLALVLQLITHLQGALSYNRRTVRSFPRDACSLTKVCFSASAGDPWLATASTIVARSTGQIKVCVVLDCKESDSIVVPPYLRSVIEVQVRTGRRFSIRKFVKRFVNGEESLVVVLDRRVELAQNWDRDLTQVIEHFESRDAVLTVPASEHAAAFPTVGARGERTAARAFANLSRETVPAVAVCPEFLAATPKTFLRLTNLEDCDWDDACALSQHARVECPAFPVLEPCPKKQRLEFLRASARASWTGKAHLNALTGLSASPFINECHLKYGGTEAAKLAISTTTSV